MSHVAVIGAGVVGLACAARLAQRHHTVTLIDPQPPGEGCSLGNAGCLSRASFVPLGLPGMWKKVPGWLLDPAGPLVVRARHLPRAAPWLWRLHRATAMARVNAIADALEPLLATTVEQWRALAQWAGVPELIRQEGYVFVYESEAAFKADALGRALRQARGVAIEVLRGGEIREFDPALSARATHMVLLPEQGHCPNPLRLSQALAARLVEVGARFERHAALGFEFAGGRVAGVRTEAGTFAADAVVIAAGAHSGPFARALGCPVLLESERGYHVMLQAPSPMPRVPVMSGEGKFFVTPMEGGLRVAGTVELAGLQAPPDFRRADRLADSARRVLADLRWQGETRWMGHRPSLPDSKPVIGRPPDVANAFFAFGHGHVGLTAAAPTAEIVADLVDGREPGIDIRPFAPERPAARSRR